MYQDTVKEKVNNIQNVAKSSKPSASHTQIFQCQEPTHQLTTCPGFTIAKRTLMGLYIQEKVGTVKVTLKGPTRVLRQRKGVVAVRQ